MAQAITIDRGAWLGYRWAAHGLGPDPDWFSLDDLLTLGVQGNRQSHGEHALSQRVERVAGAPVSEAISAEGPLVYAWSVRGAPHAHRADRLDMIREALAPLPSDEGGKELIRAVDVVADALTSIVTRAVSKAEASSRVTDVVPQSLVVHCARCQARHVPEPVFRAAGRQARIVLAPEDGQATILRPCPKTAQQNVENPRRRLLEAFLRMNGPTTRPLYREWTEAGTRGVRDLWDECDDLVHVRIGPKRYDVPEPFVERIRTAPPARGIALAPQNDPYLRHADRGLLVPDGARRAEVFKALSGPGAVLVDGEVAGVWRYRRSPAQVRIEMFDPISADRKRLVGQRAHALADSTGDTAPTVVWA
ncbi:DNA glycosylase AlkZ-like family protein [Tomitella fengzijianii]|uniref:Winged helix DNA-binding domain-containing protein n=1 Tax=Tomitella fengzijianii TaxID=2597660 RepID=A0A516X4F8_9ACTN|nr:crosslink repair DNA glycosylase YcaQ family protein [Tomitella fengzijianii]QDQ97541.1 winged helix DNA-binding domain-containing protein [Tomitella fengzijianii]